ncbi:MAG: cyclic pyranopterin monophosphate synthase MoaC [Verrucomicrobiota bacterium]
MNESVFSHLDPSGEARMVDVGDKPVVRREAIASGTLRCAPSTIAALRAQALPKGDVLAVARVAAIQAAKRTDELVPLCHSLPLDRVAVDFEIEEAHIAITATASTSAKTGVEMEALTAVAVAGLTLYDMLKAVDKAMVLGEIRVVKKTKQ